MSGSVICMEHTAPDLVFGIGWNHFGATGKSHSMKVHGLVGQERLGQEQEQLM